MRSIGLILCLVALVVPSLSQATDDTPEALLPTTATAAAALGSCTSENAPGTPKGAECRCSVSGSGAKCVTLGDKGVGCWNNERESEACYWSSGDGCICQAFVDGQPVL